jgi:hypothetical protein
MEAVAPGLVGLDREEWIKKVKLARNFEAHRLVDGRWQTDQERIDDYYQLAGLPPVRLSRSGRGSGRG